MKYTLHFSGLYFILGRNIKFIVLLYEHEIKIFGISGEIIKLKIFKFKYEIHVRKFKEK